MQSRRVSTASVQMCSRLDLGARKLSGAVDLVAEAGATYYYRVVVSELPKMSLSLRVEPCNKQKAF